jgi:LmbE family N-acetylglucosaminyl deacetylase
MGLWQSLKRLQTTARVMHLTAHPDDEDGGLITMLSRGQGVDVTLASITRGEAGANLVTGDSFDALGDLRTAELLRAADYYGVKVRFTRFVDFGYSKNLEETFQNWDREAVLGDVVRLIRMEKPHVLIARWQGTPRDGHGNHEAAGVLAQLAFEAAGDPKRFPGLPPWQPQKLYSGNRRENEPWTVRVDSGVYDPVLGRSYAQMAREGLRHQRSQGAGSAVARPGPSVTYYKLLASKVGMAEKEESFFERLDVSLSAHPELARHVQAAVEAFSLARPEACAPHLAAALKAARSAGHREKEEQIQRSLALAAGIEVEALVDPESAPSGPLAGFRGYETFALATPGQTFGVTVTAHLRGRSDAELRGVELVAPEGSTVSRMGKTQFRVTVSPNALPTKAHWRRQTVRQNLYRIEPPEWFGRPLPPPPLVARVTYVVSGADAVLEREVETSYIDRLGVQHRRALAVGPAVSVKLPAPAGVLPAGKREYTLTATVRNNLYGPAKGTVRLALPQGWRSDPAGAPFAFEKQGEEVNVAFRLLFPATVEGRDHLVEVVATMDGREYRSTFTPVTQPGLETVYRLEPAVQYLRSVDARAAPGQRIGYVMGTGDDVPEGLRQLGAGVDLLDASALAGADLSRYDSIWLGIRAYAARPDVKTYNARLLEYVKNGGVLVVQYNTQEYDRNYGPYPYSMTARAEEVSEENSPVEILDPNDPVFTWPNRITLRDFEGWIEQRGSKFWTTWDPAYKPLLATHDRGQAPQRGGWLVARHGKGLYIYCAYAWYRQLPFAVPGAVRMVANLASLGAKDAPWRK